MLMKLGTRTHSELSSKIGENILVEKRVRAKLTFTDNSWKNQNYWAH